MTAEQQDLAMRHVPLALMLARSMTAKLPHLRAEARSAALCGLCESAAAWSPEGSTEFTTYARFRVLGSIRDMLRRSGPRGFTRNPSAAPQRVEGIDMQEIEHHEPPGELIDAADLIGRLLRDLPRHHKRIMVALHTEARCADVGGAAEAFRMTPRRVREIRRESVRMIRENLNGITP